MIRLALLCDVTGVFDAEGQSIFGSDQDDVILNTAEGFKQCISGTEDVGRINLSVNEGFSTEKAQENISVLLRQRRRIVP